MAPDKGNNTKCDPSVGDVVTVTLPETERPEQGRIVDDFGVVLGSEAAGRTWAPARRWAVALESGRLVFADTTDLTSALP